MITGLGLDIVEVERMKTVFERWGDRIIRRLFTDREVELWDRSGIGSVPRLAGRFAAKEAAMKALGVGWGPSATWHDFEIINDDKGKPVLSMTGSASRTAEGLGVRETHISISHSPMSACAVVVMES